MSLAVPSHHVSDCYSRDRQTQYSQLCVHFQYITEDQTLGGSQGRVNNTSHGLTLSPISEEEVKITTESKFASFVGRYE